MPSTGSRKWMLYTANDGSTFGVKIDESNGESLGYGDVTPTNVGDLKPLPQGFKQRYLNCVLVDGTDVARRAFKIGTQAAYQAAIASRTLTVDGDTWNVSSYRDEQSSLPFAFDTGLTDGDAT